MGKWESKGESDEWYTPKYIFDALGCSFDLDVACPVDRKFIHVPAQRFIHKDSLNKVWQGFVWCNPPYEGKNSKGPWLDKLKKHGEGIALVPDRSSTSWWQKAAQECDALLMVEGKIKFIKPDGSTGNSPGNGSTLFAYGEEAVNALLKAQNKGLGIIFKRI